MNVSRNRAPEGAVNLEPARQKAALRSLVRTARRARTDEARLAASYAICATVLALLERPTAGTVLGYWPIEAQREVDISPVLDDFLNRGVPVALPVAQTAPAPDGSPAMSAHRYVARSDLRPGPWGLFEPASGIAVPKNEIAIVLVPALALDPDGFRLGYGMGYYDRFLAGLPALKIGIAFEYGYRSAVPFEAHDVRVDLVVTERRLVRTLSATWLPRQRTELRKHIDWGP